MAGNVVEILVKSRDKTKDGFSSANKGASSFGDKMKQVNRVAVGASLAIGAGLLVWGKHTATALGRIEKLSAQTESAVRSMGVSWTSTKEIEAYSAELERLTGVEAETIQEGQNLLLTFGQIQNRVGEGNDIFNQATRAVTDMSVALGQDTKSSAIQLGKALNDPIKGVTALQRVGVSFTASQKEQISALVESGKTMEAQKLILGELTRQFGGSAEAFGETMPGQVAKLKNSFGELSESLLTALMPAFQSIMGLLAEFAAWALENQGAVMAIGAVFLGLAAAVLTVNAAVKVWQAGVVIATAVQWLWNIAMTANPIGIIIVAIAAFVAAIIILWNK